MKLYYSPGACSLAPHILLEEVQLPYSLVKVDLGSHRTSDGADYITLNPKGAVPVLELDAGERLSEGPIIAQYIADRANDTRLMPAAGTLARYRVMEWQNYITSELHKSFSPLFGNPALDAAGTRRFSEALNKKLGWTSSHLHGRAFLTGETFTAADAYLFVVAGWSKHVGIDLDAYPELRDFVARVSDRPAVQASLQQEGLKA